MRLGLVLVAFFAVQGSKVRSTTERTVKPRGGTRSLLPPPHTNSSLSGVYNSLNGI